MTNVRISCFTSIFIFVFLSLIRTSKSNIMLKIYSLLSVKVEHTIAYTLVTLLQYIVNNINYLKSLEIAKTKCKTFCTIAAVGPMARRAATMTRLHFLIFLLFNLRKLTLTTVPVSLDCACVFFLRKCKV